jgi:hypothetical protein
MKRSYYNIYLISDYNFINNNNNKDLTLKDKVKDKVIIIFNINIYKIPSFT